MCSPRAILVLLAALLLGSHTALAAGPGWRAKVDPNVLERVEEGHAPFFLYLRAQADVSAASALPTKIEKGSYVFERLTATAQRTQPAIVRVLRSEAVDFKAFWVANMIWVQGDAALLEQLAHREDVARIFNSPEVRLPEPLEPGEVEAPGSRAAIEWNIERVNAPDVWAAGVTGEGTVVAGLDTGCQWDHPALINQYRGWNGSSVDHNYHWHDAVHATQDACGPDSPVPCDIHGHGTHITGTMIGDDGSGNRIGMAPGAKWIHCRLWEPDLRSDISYVTECLQWTLAPTDLNDQNPDPSKAPHVVSNSWICEPDEGCVDPNAILPVVENLRAAGIVVVSGAGNNGPNCSTVRYPPGMYAASLGIGATDRFDNIAPFSSRGPVTIDGSGRLKPDVSAPGREVRSSFPTDTYFVWEGTSMATPHVSGLVALLVSANPDLAGQVETLESIITETAVPFTSAQTCGGVPGSEIPNNTFGWGRIDAFAAYQQAIGIATAVPEVAHLSGSLLEGGQPNPFSSRTMIRYAIPAAGEVRLHVYDVAGHSTKPAARSRREPTSRISSQATRGRPGG
jgi:subtilisin family serine protease